MRGVRVGAAGMAMALMVGLSLAACGDDDDAGSTGSEPAGSETEETTPEDLRASDADVATGLQEIDDLVDQVATGVGDGDSDAATEANDQIEPAWQGIEGTIKANDEDAYISFEDGFATLGNAIDDGDAEAATAAADTVSETVAAYLADHPG